MSEALKFEGRLALYKREAAELRLRISGDVNSVRNFLDPFEAPENLRAQEAAAQAVELAEKVIRLKALVDQIAAVERELRGL